MYNGGMADKVPEIHDARVIEGELSPEQVRAIFAAGPMVRKSIWERISEEK